MPTSPWLRPFHFPLLCPPFRLLSLVNAARRCFGGGSCWESLLAQFDSKQCREQFVTPLFCFPKSRCNSLALRTPVLLRLLIGLCTYGGVDSLGEFPLFLKMVEDIIAPK